MSCCLAGLNVLHVFSRIVITHLYPCCCFRISHFKHYYQLSGSKLLMVSLPRPLICLRENLISLTKLHLFLVYSFHFRRKNAERAFVGMFHLWKFFTMHAQCVWANFALFNRELEKIEMQGDDLYLPTAPNKLVRSIRVDSGIPLQSAAKVPIMITFNVVDRNGDQNNIKPQACIFKVCLVRLCGLKSVCISRLSSFFDEMVGLRVLFGFWQHFKIIAIKSLNYVLRN